MIIQIYEIQTPHEAEVMINAGVDHIGSVLLSEIEWKKPLIKETVEVVHGTSTRASLIPLFNEPESIFRILDYYSPDIVHFCEDLIFIGDDVIEALLGLQKEVRSRFPHVAIMRSIPVPIQGVIPTVFPATLTERFASVTDYFLIDTHIAHQPVNGFVGITGKVCDWDLAAGLVQTTDVPVILAGGIHSDNVYDGIMRVQPAGVDSCTGTNTTDNSGNAIRFRKDPKRVARLVDAVRQTEMSLDKKSIR